MINKLDFLGLRHVALLVKNLEKCVEFYCQKLGMVIEWQPDPDNYYLTSGSDNLALHRAPENFHRAENQALDHMGFILKTPEAVDAWYEKLRTEGVTIKAEPKTHRDGARSFYCCDPDGNVVQFIYHPPLVLTTPTR